MSSLSDLMEVLQQQYASIQARPEDSRVHLHVLFSSAIKTTMQEIKAGADPLDFSDLVVINLILAAAHEGFDAQEIQDFVEDLTHTAKEEGFTRGDTSWTEGDEWSF